MPKYIIRTHKTVQKTIWRTPTAGGREENSTPHRVSVPTHQVRGRKAAMNAPPPKLITTAVSASAAHHKVRLRLEKTRGKSSHTAIRPSTREAAAMIQKK